MSVLRKAKMVKNQNWNFNTLKLDYFSSHPTEQILAIFTKENICGFAGKGDHLIKLNKQYTYSKLKKKKKKSSLALTLG